jgi:peroxiredoxin
MKSNIIPGKKVPFLQLDTIEGLTWSTADHLNKKNSMIIFYRGLHCPVCSVFLKQVDNQLLITKSPILKSLQYLWITKIKP